MHRVSRRLRSLSDYSFSGEQTETDPLARASESRRQGSSPLPGPCVSSVRHRDVVPQRLAKAPCLSASGPPFSLQTCQGLRAVSARALTSRARGRGVASIHESPRNRVLGGGWERPCAGLCKVLRGPHVGFGSVGSSGDGAGSMFTRGTRGEGVIVGFSSVRANPTAPGHGRAPGRPLCQLQRNARQRRAQQLVMRMAQGSIWTRRPGSARASVASEA